MIERLRLPHPQIATKLYGAIALILAVVYVLAAAATNFAGRTEEAVRQFQGDGLGVVLLSASLEVGLEQQRRVVTTAPFLSDWGTRQQDERAFADLTAQIPALMQGMGYGPSHELSQQYADLAQLGAMVLAFVRDERLYQASVMAAQYAQSMQDFQRQVAAERQRRSRAGEAVLENVASSSRALVTWVCAAAAVSGLLIGPIGLLLLRRVL
jgi:hypothetical protein